jgi:multisubunit Na+/H+ antiporter MnhF subunit
MNPTRQMALELLLGVAIMVLAVIVFVLNRTGATDVLAVIGFLGGVAVIINALPLRTGNGDKS